MINCPSVLCICLLALSFSHFCDCFVIGDIESKAHCNSQLKMTSEADATATSSRPCCIQNFRQAAGLPRIYRCASTDPLADILNDKSWHEPERVLLQDTGLILDLRSDSERNDQQAQQWMSQAPTPFLVQDVNPETHEVSSGKNDRRVLRIDVLSPTRFMEYASDNWFTPSQKAMANLYWVFDAGKVHEMRIDALNERGLTGLNEIILETGGRELCVALQEITIHLEENPNSNVAIHCVQGKDRTGMLAMLCQSIVGLSDVDILDDYHKSDSMRASSASEVMKPRRKGKLDRNVFAGSPREACVGALDFVRSKYGSVCPGYLDAIGFDEQWRRRFRSIAMTKQEASLQISKL
jgi:hypothetical protein